MCVSTCSHKAIDGMKLRPLTSLGPVSVLRFQKHNCSSCGRAIPGDTEDGLCVHLPDQAPYQGAPGRR